MVKLARDLTKGNAYATSIHVRTLERERWRVGRMRRAAHARKHAGARTLESRADAPQRTCPAALTTPAARARALGQAINSCVIKLSKLTKAGKVWRGIRDATLPPEFWVPSKRQGTKRGTVPRPLALRYLAPGLSPFATLPPASRPSLPCPRPLALLSLL